MQQTVLLRINQMKEEDYYYGEGWWQTEELFQKKYTEIGTRNQLFSMRLMKLDQ